VSRWLPLLPPLPHHPSDRRPSSLPWPPRSATWTLSSVSRERSCRSWGALCGGRRESEPRFGRTNHPLARPSLHLPLRRIRGPSLPGERCLPSDESGGSLAHHRSSLLSLSLSSLCLPGAWKSSDQSSNRILLPWAGSRETFPASFFSLILAAQEGCSWPAEEETAAAGGAAIGRGEGRPGWSWGGLLELCWGPSRWL
jgi:hypothetical protein